MKKNRFQMPRCKGDKMQSRRRRAKKSKVVRGIPDFSRLKAMNEFYINNVPSGIPAECVKCKNWRLVKEYQETHEVPKFFECSMWNLGDGEKGNCYIPQLQDDGEFTDERFTPGSLVWAKMPSYPRWPAMVEDDPELLQYYRKDKTNPEYHVVFFGDRVYRGWIKDKSMEPFTFKSLNEMPSIEKGRKDLQRAIEEAVKALSLKKEKRLMDYSFATRYEENARIKAERQNHKKTKHDNKNSKSSCTQLEEDYTAGDLVWVEKAGYPRRPGMVENDPAEMKYFKDLDADADEMLPGKLGKALKYAEEAMRMTKQDRLMKFSFSVRNGKRRNRDENEGGAEGQRSLDNDQHERSSTNNLKRKRTSKLKLEPLAKKSLRTSDVEPDTQFTGNRPLHEDYQSHICSEKVPQDSGTFKQLHKSFTKMNIQPPNEEMDVLVTDKNKNDEPYDELNGDEKSPADISRPSDTENNSSDHCASPETAYDTDTEISEDGGSERSGENSLTDVSSLSYLEINSSDDCANKQTSLGIDSGKSCENSYADISDSSDEEHDSSDSADSSDETTEEGSSRLPEHLEKYRTYLHSILPPLNLKDRVASPEIGRSVLTINLDDLESYRAKLYEKFKPLNWPRNCDEGIRY